MIDSAFANAGWMIVGIGMARGDWRDILFGLVVATVATGLVAWRRVR